MVEVGGRGWNRVEGGGRGGRGGSGEEIKGIRDEKDNVLFNRDTLIQARGNMRDEGNKNDMRRTKMVRSTSVSYFNDSEVILRGPQSLYPSVSNLAVVLGDGVP